ncbi:DUF748 domain-containing protein [Desulfoprunum benzoelyticum]|uniref:Uncharacterized protein involved in outer membrane biogenesis n=1 Tax=Desulfoprunum benzoelyticum TaxID=1506996 RepID=A0A840UZE3_9BACT|nr:DUF748 domain-containing protein [Desulfoprunum benzoelyticum]MBB5348824.1 uncharacterized protein involved in outer membrane biogenesis [Desulfoprunum benzoelyticum]MBM9529986.1 DUF748 domain-containing protein [Desulfoprunum benzoelyticum]
MSDNFGNISISPAGPERPPASTAGKGRSDRRLKKRVPDKKRPGKKDRPATPGSTGRLIKVLIPGILLLPLLYALGGFWLVPLYLKKSLPETVNARTGMDLAIKAIKFNPFTFNFSLQDLQLQASRPSEDNRHLLRISRIEADLAPLSLLRHDLVSNSLAIKGIEMNIVRSHDNRYNIKDLFSVGRTGTSSDIISFAELPFLFSLNNISIRDSSVTFQDIPAATTHTVEQIELDLPSLSNFPFETSQYIRPKFSAVINGSKVELTGQTSIPAKANDTGSETKLSCRIEGVDLPQYFNYLPVTAPIALTKGKADGSLELTFTRGTMEQEARFSIDFTGRVADMEITGEEYPLEATIPNAVLEGSFSPIDRRLHIRKLSLTTPRMQGRETEIVALTIPFLPTSGNSTEQPAGGPRPISATVDLFAIEDGSVAIVRDEKAKPESWSSLQMTVRNYRWNTPPPADGTSGGSFKVSGENTASDTTFSWQGAIESDGALNGPYQLDNISAATFLATIGMPPETVRSGKANLQGKLKVSREKAKEMRPAVDLWETETTLQDLKLVAGGKLWLQAPILTLSGLSRSGAKVNLGDLRLENGSIALQAGEFPDTFTALAAQNGKITVNSIDYSGKISVAGKTSTPLALSSVLLQAKSLDNRQNTGDNLVFSATINSKGNIKARGTARLAPFQATLDTGFSGLEAQTMLPWFSSLPLLTEARTTLAGKGQLTLPDASFNGELKFDEAVFKHADKPLLTWKQCDIQGLSYSRRPFHLGIAQMDIDSPVMNWQRAPDKPHPSQQFGAFLQDMLPEEKTVQSGDKGKIATSQLDIGKITITNGKIPYRDTRLSPPWSTTILITEGSITNIHSSGAGETGRFSFSGNLDQTAFTLSGAADLFGKTPGGETAFQASNWRLSDFAKYVPPELGIDSRKATFSATGSTTWNNGRLAENARFVFSNLQTAADADAALPLAFLTDTEGKVVLEIKGERDLPGENIPVLHDALATFQRQIIKAKVSPILLAGSDFADLVGSEFAEFRPGGYELTEQGRKILARFAALCSSHPFVGIRITGAADRIVDGDALNRQLEDSEARRVAEENERRKAAWQEARDEELARRRSEASTSQDFIEEDLMLDYPAFVPLKPAPVAFQDSMLKDLARRRAELVQKLLVDQLSLAPPRITVATKPRVTADSDAPGNRALLELRAIAAPKNAAGDQGGGKE